MEYCADESIDSEEDAFFSSELGNAMYVAHAEQIAKIMTNDQP